MFEPLCALGSVHMLTNKIHVLVIVVRWLCIVVFVDSIIRRVILELYYSGLINTMCCGIQPHEYSALHCIALHGLNR